MNDTQQELQQRSLRNVRAYLDKEEEEARRQKKTTRQREREIRSQNPDISPSEVGRRLQVENAAIKAAAAKECRS